MRDLALAVIVFGLLPFIFKRPFWGILLMVWLGYMNPHRLCYGFMLSMPVVQIVVIATMIGMLVSKEAKRMVWSPEVTVLVLFIIWMGITTTQAFYLDLAYLQYTKVIKIQIITIITLVMLTSKEKVHAIVWVFVLSLGFYGLKGGVFTILHGGVYRVQGPFGTFIGGNNELALALVMTIPLIRYLQLQEKHHLVKLGLSVGMFLTVIAAIGSQSRGALVALLLTGSIFWIKSRNKFVTAVFIIIAGLAVVSIMPESWYERMNTINSYESDGSAMGRINAWWTAWNLATHRFLGGGFEMWQYPVFEQYAPIPGDVHDAHSIYFKVLGEHGFVGLFLFLLLLILMWLKCRSIIKISKQNPDQQWARDLAAMIQVSMVAYLTGGAFLGLAYFDYIYHLMAVVVVVHYLVKTPALAGQDSVRLNPNGDSPIAALSAVR
ncbi:MAG: putative O-glycosylation ligase, exosortase A system-associated [Pseudomonadota bacterium]|nr:putative O-glycosylation ligase, exosortase A system-associated [Pseudomonadota bacterium]